MLDKSVITIKKLFSEFPMEEPMLEYLLTEAYSAKYLVPIVHSGTLLSFILLSPRNPEEKFTLSSQEKFFLDQLSDRLQINLYASSIADKSQRRLLTISSFPLTLKDHKTLNELYENIIQDLSKEISFDKGICYIYEPNMQMLIPVSSKGIRANLKFLKENEGISGQTFTRNQAIFVPDRKTHPTYSLMKEEKFITNSFIAVPISSGETKYGVVVLSRKNSFDVEHRYMLEIASSFIASEIANRRLYIKLEDANFQMVHSLTKALEAKDSYTEGHSSRVTKYVVEIAKKLNYSESDIFSLRYGALLHDIGKIGISDAVINKHSKLTDNEFSEIKAHAEIGYQILNGNVFFDRIKDFVRFHHETIQGTGYYNKKLGEFPQESMIISIADIFDAITSDRPYRKTLGVEEALEELKKQINVHFTQEIYDAFYECLKDNEFRLAQAD